MKFLRVIILSTFVGLGALKAQTIQGPTSVTLTSTATYRWAGPFGSPGFIANKGTVVSQTSSGGTHTAMVFWYAAGAGSVSVQVGTSIVTTLPVTIINCAIATPAVTNASRCGTGSVTLQATPGVGGSIVRWYTSSSGGTFFTTGTSYTTPSLAVTTAYYVTTYNSTNGCETPRVAVTATIHSIPSSPTGNSTTFCGSGSVTLTGSPGTNGNTLRWYDAISGGNLLATATGYDTPALSASATYYISSYHTDSGCESASRVPVTVTVTPLPLAPTGTNASNCGTGAVALSATPGTNGNTVRWYSGSSGGTPLATTTTYTTPSLATTTTYYISSYNTNTGCESTSSRVAVIAAIHTIPGQPTGTNGSRNGQGTVNLSGTPGGYATTLRWYDASTGGNLLATTGIFTTPSISVTTTYYITSYHSGTGCENTGPRVPVIATVNPVPDAPTGTNAARCGAGTVTLTGTSGVNGNTVRWYDASTGGTLLATGTIYSPDLSVTTTYYISSYNTSTAVESTTNRVALTATIHPVPSAPTAANGSVCGTGTVTLSGTPGTNGNTLRWYSASSGGTLLTTNTSYTTPSLSSATSYYISSYNTSTGCESTSARVPVTATVHPVPGAPSGSPQSGCQGTSVSLSGTPGGYSTTLRWYNAGTSGTLLATTGIYNTPNLNSTTTYYITSYNSGTGCESTSARVPVTATIHTTPAAPAASNGAICGAGTVSLSGTPATGGNTLRWYDTSSGGTLLATATSYAPTISVSTNYFISTYNSTTGCESGTRTPIVATVNPVPSAATGSNAARCGPGEVTLNGTPGTNANTLRWYTAGGTLLATNTSYTTTGLSATTPYYITSYNNSTGCESPSPRTAVTATIHTLPSAPTGTDGVRCGPGSVRLSGTPGGYSTTLRWYSASTNGTLLATAGIFDTPTLSATTTYYITSYHSGIGCESAAPRVPVIASIYTSLPSAPATTDGAICGPGAVNLSGTPGSGATAIKWYDVASGGTALATSTGYTTPTINATTTYYASSYNSVTTCESAPRVPVTATVHAVPPMPTVTPDNRLGPGTILLAASGTSSGGTYNWYTPGHTLLTTGISYTTPVITSSQSNYLYVRSKSSAQCESNAVWVSITIHALPVITASPDRIVFGKSVTLDAVGTGYTSYVWKNSSGSVVSTNKSFSTNIPSSYTVTVTKTGANGTGTTAPYRLRSQLEGVDINYVVSNTVQIENIKSIAAVDDLPVESHRQEIQYFDGLGRSAQTVVTQGSPGRNDMVQPVVYDDLGREFRKYLPFVPAEESGLYKAGIIDAQTGDYIGSAGNFYNNIGGAIADDNNKPFSETIFEPSPLSRVVKQGAAGASWQPDNDHSYLSADHTIKKAYETNTADEVLLFAAALPDPNNTLGIIGLDFRSYYAPNELYKNKTKDEHGNETIEFVDKRGRTLVKKVQVDAATYAETYYIYDPFSKLICALQPEGTKNILNKLSTSPWSALNGVSVDAAFNITKVSTSNTYGGGAAVSAEILGAGQDGWVEMVAAETDKARMIGLAATNVNAGSFIQYALELRENGHIYIWENNVAGADLGAYVTGTKVRVSRKGSEVKYYVNGIYRQTSAVASTGTLMVDLAIKHTGGTIKGVNFSFGVTSVLQQALNNFAFRYAYDGRNRMTHKLVPGSSLVYMVYDGRNRLVLTQDGNLRKNNSGTDLKHWHFTKYDAANRPVATGIYTADSVLSQEKMQARVNRYYNQAVSNVWSWHESFSVTNHVHGYNNKSFPVVTDPLQYLTIKYYDNYDFKAILPDSSLYIFRPDELPGEQKTSYFKRLNGLVTGTKVKVLEGGLAGGTTWQQTVNYFDDRYHIIQTHADNLTMGVDRYTNVHDFLGRILRTRTSHRAMWKDLAGVSITGNNIVKTAAGNSWGTAGAASIEKLPAGQDGWIEVTVSENNTARMIGFSQYNTDAGYASIDYAIYLASGGLYIYEKGVGSTNKGPTVSGDVVRIERTGSTIRYYKNGSVVSTSPTPSTTDLIVDVSLNTNGATLSTIRTSFTGNPRTITRTFTYDHAGRLSKTWHQVGQEPPVLISHNTYNELGQLIDKRLHSTQNDASDAKQSVDYRYNIRGWLTSMNNASLGQDPQTNNDSGDFFGFELGYNGDIGVGNPQLFNGNISAMKWSNDLGAGEVKEKAYVYSYDGMNRMLGASYKEKASAWNPAANNGFSESGYVYDLNGNIKNLVRYDQRGNTAPMDNLMYDYGTGATQSNRLLKVSEKTGLDAGDKFKGFADGTNTGNDYTYDTNGNLITDQNKGITSNITYNYLNLPAAVQRGGSSVSYVYDATGRKLSRLTAFGNGTRKRADYIGAFQYENSSLQFIDHEEGRVVLAQNKLVYRHAGDTLTDLESINCTADRVTQNGGETYVRVTSSGTTAGTGIFPIGQTVSVQQGERYKVRAKGYMTGIQHVYVLVKTNGVNLSWLQARLAGQTSAAESWIETEIIIPAGHTTLQVGLAWNTVVAGAQFFMNEFEIIRMMENAAPEYQYHLKDHVGNVRLTFTTKHETETYTASLELASQEHEENTFKNYDPTDWDLFDHTDSGSQYTHSQLLHGGNNSQVGLAKSLPVMPGDTLAVEVYAKYRNVENPGSGLTGFAVALTSAFGMGAPLPGDPGVAYNALDSYGTLIEGGLDHSEYETAPRAYLNILFFDREHNFVDAAYKQISINDVQTGEEVKAPHGYLSLNTIAKTAGYAYIFVSNENPLQVDVYFDDLKITHSRSPVVQTDDYYPFGLPFHSYKRMNSLDNHHLYNGKENQDDLELDWLDYGARMYMPDIGRWGAIDPLANRAYSTSPFNYALNSPINYADHGGKFPIPVIFLVYEGLAYAFTATAAMYVVTNHDKLFTGIHFGGESSVLEARGKAKDPYWARYVWKNNRGVALDVGQPMGNDMEPNPNPNSKDNKPGTSFNKLAIAFLTLAVLSNYQEFKDKISEARKDIRSTNKVINERIDAIYERLDELDYEKDNEEYLKLVEEKSILQDLRTENEQYQQGLNYMENTIDDINKMYIHPQDATRRQSDQYYSQEFLELYYKKRDKDEDK